MGGYSLVPESSIAVPNIVNTVLQNQGPYGTQTIINARLANVTARKYPRGDRQKKSHVIVSSNKPPPEALITLGTYQIISQEWLSRQPPLDGFFEELQKINPSPEQTDYTKRQCWEDGGIYRYNHLGSQWILEQLGARSLIYDEIIEIYKNVHGENNIDKMKNMGVVITGRRDEGDSHVGNTESIYICSSSPDGFGGILIAWLDPDSPDPISLGFSLGAGMVPFGVMNTRVPT